MIPYINEPRPDYILRMQAEHLAIAKLHHDIGQEHAMWVQLFTLAMSEDLYGAHWDKVHGSH